jgi:hypothetical protein
MKTFKRILFCFFIGAAVLSHIDLEAQNKALKYDLNESGEHYVRFTGLAQIWLRNTQMNPGTTINGQSTGSYSDISIRRLRFQIYGQLTDRVFFYSQFGQNNFNYHSTKYTGTFFHDAIIEYSLVKDQLSIGAGLTGWSGLSRYSAPSVGSFLTLDAPLYQQSTNGVNDQFLRKLSIYAKGQIGKLDYRVAITQPMTITGLATTDLAPTTTDFSFSNMPANKQYQGYFKFMFLDKESNLTPYQVGSYLGTKRMFNVGAGFIYQKDAMWALDGTGNSIQNDMALYNVDVFYDQPLSDKEALTFYAAFSNFDFGKNYIRNIGVNNPATGSTGVTPGGFGNALPMIGTGNTFYSQIGFLFGENILNEGGKIQPFAAIQYSQFDYLAENMAMYELGANYYLDGTQGTKLSFVYQNRPAYASIAGENVLNTRKGMAVIQCHVSF